MNVHSIEYIHRFMSMNFLKNETLDADQDISWRTLNDMLMRSNYNQ